MNMDQKVKRFLFYRLVQEKMEIQTFFVNNLCMEQLWQDTMDMVSLYDQKIGFCKACYSCFKTGKCVLLDDMEMILDKIQMSDILVIATPTYFMTMNGMLKNTIDRFLPRWQNLGGHEVYFIITGHDEQSGLELVGKELKTIFEHLGNTVKGIIWGENVWQKGEVLSTTAMQEAYQAGLDC